MTAIEHPEPVTSAVPVAAARPSTPAAAPGFAQALDAASKRTTPATPIKGDINGDGRIDKAETVALRIKELMEMLLFDTLRSGQSPTSDQNEALKRLGQLHAELVGRISRGDPVTDSDLADIASEAIAIFQAAAKPGERARLIGDDSPSVDGRIQWKLPERTAAPPEGEAA